MSLSLTISRFMVHESPLTRQAVWLFLSPVYWKALFIVLSLSAIFPPSPTAEFFVSRRARFLDRDSQAFRCEPALVLYIHLARRPPLLIPFLRFFILPFSLRSVSPLMAPPRFGPSLNGPREIEFGLLFVCSLLLVFFCPSCVRYPTVPLSVPSPQLLAFCGRAESPAALFFPMTTKGYCSFSRLPSPLTRRVFS